MVGEGEYKSTAGKRASRDAFFVFLLLIGTYACFLQDTANWNTTPRLALTAEFVQHGRLTIDGYEDLTGDRASYNGHFYSDKAPGVSLLAVPAAFMFTRFQPIGPELFGSRAWTLYAYVCTLSVSGLVTAFAGAMLFWFVRRRTGRLDAALVGALTFGLATPVFGWSTAFFGHATAGALLLLGFIALQLASAGKARLLYAAAGGLALGAAITAEYTAAISAAIIGLMLLVSMFARDGPASTAKAFSVAAIGGLIGLAPALLYNAAAFGSPFSLGYSHVIGFDGMQTGLFGIGAPSPSVLGELTIGVRRGVLWFCPAVIVMAGVWSVALANKHLRVVCVAAGLVAGWYLLYNAGYVYWDGGWSTGPRHLTPAFALLSLVVGLGWPMLRTWAKASSLVLLGCSVLINLATVSVDMMAPERLLNPIVQHILPAVLSGAHRAAITYHAIEHNTPLHLLPVLGVWLIWGVLFWFRSDVTRYIRGLRLWKMRDGLVRPLSR